MTNREGISSTRGARIALIAGLLISAAQAQQPYPPPAQPYPGSTPSYPNPAYPSQQPTYPGVTQGYPPNGQVSAGYPGAPPVQPESHFFRDLFAGTLAAVMQTFSGGFIGAITGRIMEWFAHKSQNSQQGYGYNSAAGYAAGGQYPNSGYGSTSAYPSQASTYPNTAYPNTAQPTYPNTAYPGTGYPQTNTTYPQTSTAYPQTNVTYPQAGTPGTATAYPGQAAYPAQSAYPGQATYPAQSAQNYGAAPPQVYDARTGQMLTGAANPYATRGLGMENAIYAGIAYEVHAMGSDGQLSPINTANYRFHNGDKFMVYYRPSLPGHMEIYNVNPKGRQTLIDSSDMAAGQMVGLGPYQFTNQAGNESLRLVLSPCSTPQLLAATRDIVRADAPPPPAAPAAPAVHLENCSTTASRSVDTHTRDIEKVGLEGTTSFALDPLSAHEMKSGQVTPREVTIVFHHE